jgi:TPR repeat protein
MADVAHNAPGPASPKPGDVALQQASRANAPDKGKLRVFISYSRDDAGFADQLEAALDAYGFETSIDRHGVSGGEEWKSRLGNLISEADTVVFVLTPTSAGSPICSWEVEQAVRLGKRILPANWRPLEGASPPPQLRERNYICFYDNPKEPGSGFGTGLAKLVAALNTDFDWLREHTRYLQRATEWDRGGRAANRLLSGDDIAEAKTWVSGQPKNAPEPTALQLDFIRASEDEAEARSNAQRKQLEAMAEAQAEREKALHQAEEALKQATDAQRRRARIRNIAFVAVSIFAVLAGWLYLDADKQRKQADDILAGSSVIFAELQVQMNDDTKKRVFDVFKTGADHGDATSMNMLGWIYHYGEGVEQDYAKAREWYGRAANKGRTRAMNGLGLLYLKGLGVPQDYNKAREWFEKAAAKGEVSGMFNLGLLYGYTRDYAKAVEWYKRSIDIYDDAEAMRNLGLLYASPGVPQDYQDYAKAREWLEKAANKGEAGAMNDLASLYANGQGVEQDYGKALQWQEAYAAKAEANEIRRLGKPSEETAEALYNVTKYALFAREFTRALTVANRARALLPDDLSTEINRAHALMFLEHKEDAKTLYLAHKGKPRKDGQLWERVIAEDFAKLRKAGLTHPMMAEIEMELGVSR